MDNTGLPYPEGLAVTLTHQRQNGSSIGLVPTCVAGPPPSCSVTLATDASGQVTVPLQSRTTPKTGERTSRRGRRRRWPKASQ